MGLEAILLRKMSTRQQQFAPSRGRTEEDTIATKKQYGGGIYSKVLKRAPGGKPLEVFTGRVWMKTEKRFRYFKLGTTLKAAQRRMGQIIGDPEAALAEREKPRPKPMRFDKLVEAFLEGYTSRGGTSYYVHAAESWKAFFRQAYAHDITRIRVEGYRDKLRRDGFSDSTVRKSIVSLGTMYRWAIGRGLLTENPTVDVCRPPEPNREVSVLSHQEEADLLAAADPQTRLVIDLLLASGMRRGEALDLGWGQVDRHGGAILIHKSKTGRPAASR
jgi:hypothetical protein